MSLEHLWAGWRVAYVTEAPEKTGATADLFERLAAAHPDEALVVARNELVFTVMNAYPYCSGHCMVAPLRRVPELEDLSDAEAAALMGMVQQAVVALKAGFHTDGVNVGINLGRAAGAGIPGHLHFHVVPRWSGDTNFMTSVAEARVMPEDLRTSYEKLKAAWPTNSDRG